MDAKAKTNKGFQKMFMIFDKGEKPLPKMMPIFLGHYGFLNNPYCI